jgi:hypothetical protein
LGISSALEKSVIPRLFSSSRKSSSILPALTKESMDFDISTLLLIVCNNNKSPQPADNLIKPLKIQYLSHIVEQITSL